MERVGMVFKIKPELKADYKKAHDEIWPELKELIKESGISNYSIYFKKDGTLFAYLEAEDYSKAMEISSKAEIAERWQEYMDRFFVNKDKSLIGPEVEIMEEVFHID